MSSPDSSADHVSLSDVAAAAGVSLATASRVMKGNSRVSPDLSERVRAAAERIGYRPNPMISSLMHQVRGGQVKAYQGIVALISQSPTRRDWEGNEVARLIFKGLEAEARKLGYKVETFLPRADGLSGGRLGGVLAARGVSGALLLERSDRFVHKAEDMLDEGFEFSKELPVVLVAHKQLHPTLSFVMSDQYANARRVGLQLCLRGYRRPLFICSHYLSAVSEGRFVSGLSSALENSNLGVVHTYGPRPSIFSEEEICQAAERDRAILLTALREHGADVVISFNERELTWLRQEGVEVPEKVGFVSLNVGAGSGPLSGIEEGHEMVGALAMRQLAEQVARGECGMQQVVSGRLVEGTWREGTTLFPVKTPCSSPRLPGFRSRLPSPVTVWDAVPPNA